MSSTIIFLLTLLQAVIIGGSYLLHVNAVFVGAVVYGSPFYLLMTLIGRDSVFLDTSPLYLGISAYHLIKYFFFFRAQMIDDSNWRRNIAIGLEGAYLALCGYYLN